MSVNPFAGHELRSPALTPAEAEAIARDVWGAEGRASELGSHQDQNFLIDGASGRWVLKIANPVFLRPELEMQNAAMLHLAPSFGGFEVQTPLHARDGSLIVGVNGYDIRLVTFLEGEPLSGCRYLAPPVRFELGRMAGAAAAALQDFGHPAARRQMQWDVAQAPDVVAALGPDVPDPARRELALRSMDAAVRQLDVLAPALRRQVIHGDVTVWNAIARQDASGLPMPIGLIDFGDMVESWLAAEAAVVACGALPYDASPAATVLADVIAGFHAACPLADAEVAALPALLYARAAGVAVSTDRQAALEPDNQYAGDLVELDWNLLARVAALPLPVLEAALRQVCS
jgi:Ser/Thr protein kinase RdoA (MazF antagonist)